MRMPLASCSRSTYLFALGAALVLVGNARTSVRCWAQGPVPAEVVAPADGYQEVVERLRAVLRRERDEKDLPAFSIALVDGDRTIWAEGFGYRDAEGKIPATAKTVYRVGSISKLLTDIAVMQCVERGELSLDRPIADYLPDFRPHNASGAPITLRQLMAHRSGLVRESPVGHYFDAASPSLPATVESLNRTSLVYAPDTRTKYSNAGIAVVGRVLEKHSGVPFAERMETSLVRPLNMRQTHFEITPALAENLATGWMWTYDGRRFAAPSFALGTAPAGNLYSTVFDLSKFLVAIFREGRGEGGAILRPETLHSMMTPQTSQSGEPQLFGLGFRVGELDGHRKVGHGGAVYGFASQLEALPDEKLGVAAVASLDCANGIVARIANYALRLLLAHRAGKPLPLWESTGPVPAERARQLVGRYRNGDSEIELTYRPGRLFLRLGDARHELRATDDGLVVDDVLAYGPRVVVENADVLTIDKRQYVRLADAPPAAPPARWSGLIGEYGWDHNTLYILEDAGRLYALIEWFYYYPLEELSENEFAFPDLGLYHGERLAFTRDANGRATQVIAAGVPFPRRQIGTPAGDTFRIRPLRPIAELRAEALQATPPHEAGAFRESQLVELTTLEPALRLDIRYATTNNFTGEKFYEQARAFLQRPAAEAVVRAHRRLGERGLGLLIFDAYRPWHVTKMFWEATPGELKHFVANPANGSRHNRGCAVDLTLCDLETGRPIPMVAGYDEFSHRSYPDYPGGTSQQRWYRELLRKTMEDEGFAVYDFEWWHFDYRDWRNYRIQNDAFEELSAG